MVYQIADFLTGEAKREMLAHHYEPYETYSCRRTRGGCCPLGIGLMEMHPSRAYRVLAPDPSEVADILSDETTLLTDYDSMVSAAKLFIADWDGNVIIDLAEALGVQG